MPPCRSDDDVPTHRAITESWAVKDLRDRNDKLTRMLCYVMGILEVQGATKIFLGESRPSAEIVTWYKLHQVEDAKRKEAEDFEKNKDQYKAAALSKLTSKEKKALGIG